MKEIILSFFVLSLAASCAHKQSPADTFWAKTLDCDPQEPSCEEF